MAQTPLLDKMIQDPGNADFASGTIKMAMGMELAFSNSLSSDAGLLVVPSRLAMVNPLGFRAEILRDKGRVADYCRISAVFGWGATGKLINCKDGSEGQGAREGLCSVVVSG